MHYKIAGQGEPALVLLHGLGASVFSWREVMGPLAEAGTIVAFDRPAFGLTTRPLSGEWRVESPYSPEAQANLTVALLETLEMEKYEPHSTNRHPTESAVRTSRGHD